ncbi:MAG: TonB-dependent receptor, partial [Saprospiraceae bacterium]|nr:TonB-dependent receptor [Saprospiraceae bacterium]
SPIIRGFEANKVLIVVDGVRMNNAIYRSGHLQNAITIDKDILERIEVLHGPAAVMYGSDALGGVMNFTTQKPLLRDKDAKKYNLNAYTRFSTANFERTTHADLNVGSKKFASLTSVTYAVFDDLRAGRVKIDTNMARYWNRYFYAEYDPIDSLDIVRINENPNVQVGTGYNQFDVLQKFRFRPNDHLDFIVNMQYSTSSNVPRYDQLTEGDFLFSQGQIQTQTFNFAEWYYGPQNRLLTSLNMKIENDSIKPFSRANIIAAFQKIDEDRITRRFGDNLRTRQSEDVYVFTLNADFVKRFNDKNSSKFLYGLEAAHNIVRSTVSTQNILTDSISYRNTGTRYPDGGSTMTTAAAYGSYRLKINDRVHILTGGRYTFTYMAANYIDTLLYQLPFDRITIPSHSFTGSVALAWDMQRQWQFKGLFSTSFRPPNIDDAGKIRAKSTTITIPNDQIRPEKALNFEISMGKTFNKYVRISGTGFYTYLFDVIVQKPFTLNDTDSLYYDGEFRAIRANVNSGRAYIWGLNGNLEIELSESAFIKGSVNFTQ